jgi:hypothetical protein
MRLCLYIAPALLAAGCQFDGTSPGLFNASGGADGGSTGEPDGGSATIEHLLLSEIKTTVTAEEFIEIYNPGKEKVELRDYYLSDTGEYANLAGAFGDGPPPRVHFSDFIARFPASASIEPGATLVVALDADGFGNRFGIRPDLALAEMLEVYTGSIGSQATLTDTGEGIALFTWDGASDLITDVDLMLAGAETSETNMMPDKTGMAIDGPGENLVATKYFSEAGSMSDMPLQTEEGESYERIALEGQSEVHDGKGNGLGGHDETSERIVETWAVQGTPSPGAVPDLTP